MNKNDVKILITFAMGVTAGALVTNQLLKVKYEELVQKEIDSVKETFGINAKNFENTVEDKAQNAKDLLEHTKLTEAYTNFNRTPYDNVEEEIDYETSDEAYGDKSINIKPYLITVDNFMDECHHYDKITLQYYMEDDTLVDEREEIIADPVAIVGEGMLLNFGGGHLESNPDVLYVRNNNIAADFEIVCISASYSETILGINGYSILGISNG